MGLQNFNLESLSTIDGGRIKEAFEQLVKRCEGDCKDRPALTTARTIGLVVKFEPVPNDFGDLDSVNVTFDIKESLPKRSSKPYNMRAVPGGLLFNEMSPEDVDQGTLEFENGPKAEATNAS